MHRVQHGAVDVAAGEDLGAQRAVGPREIRVVGLERVKDREVGRDERVPLQAAQHGKRPHAQRKDRKLHLFHFQTVFFQSVPA